MVALELWQHGDAKYLSLQKIAKHFLLTRKNITLFEITEIWFVEKNRYDIWKITGTWTF